MTNLQLIHHIATHPEYTVVVIKSEDDKTPMQAIELLSCEAFDNDWRINGSLEKNVLLIYDSN